MTDGPILRLFEVKVKDGCQELLLQKFAKTSAEVVADEPGNAGYFFGKILDSSEDIVIFASVWDDLDAIRLRFGADWRSSFLDEQIKSGCKSKRMENTKPLTSFSPD